MTTNDFNTRGAEPLALTKGVTKSRYLTEGAFMKLEGRDSKEKRKVS